MNNYGSSSDDDDDNNLTPDEMQQLDELMADTDELKKVAARTVLRATQILDMNPQDNDVARMLLAEAVVMMQIVHRIETLFKNDSGK